MKSILLALVSILFVSCFPEGETAKTVDYTVQLTATRTDSGLYYVINVAGTGTQPTASSNVTVEYKGYYTNGSVFDGGKPGGLTFGLNEVIKGWTEGIPFFKEGGNGILLIPAHIGYGSNTTNGIPGGSVLVFDVKLIKVN
jgi:FKBP-type peptidyl-prolyl cis-trans isomerase FkpA